MQPGLPERANGACLFTTGRAQLLQPSLLLLLLLLVLPVAVAMRRGYTQSTRACSMFKITPPDRS